MQCVLWTMHSNLPVFLRTLVTWSCCHGTQERDAKVPTSWEDKGSVDLPLPSCAIAVHTIPTTASTNVDSVVNGNVQISPDELRWTHPKMQRPLTGGESLQDVAASLRQGAVQPSELPKIGIVRH